MSGRVCVGTPEGVAFGQALVEAVTTMDRESCESALANWTKLPDARHYHRREEHLLPLLVTAGTALDGKVATRTFSDSYLRAAMSGFRFG